jgi:hypothetical protein
VKEFCKNHLFDLSALITLIVVVFRLAACVEHTVCLGETKSVAECGGRGK